MVTKEQVLDIQKKWANGLMKIGSLKNNSEDCEQFAKRFIDEIYAFDHGVVLFKPTRCALEQFRPTKSKALSYFVGGVNKECCEDHGFGKVAWKNVRFENHNYILEERRAIVMGNYYFTDVKNNDAKVEFTFGYKLIDGTLKIDLHHSSLPFSLKQ